MFYSAIAECCGKQSTPNAGDAANTGDSARLCTISVSVAILTPRAQDIYAYLDS